MLTSTDATALNAATASVPSSTSSDVAMLCRLQSVASTDVAVVFADDTRGSDARRMDAHGLEPAFDACTWWCPVAWSSGLAIVAKADISIKAHITSGAVRAARILGGDDIGGQRAARCTG